MKVSRKYYYRSRLPTIVLRLFSVGFFREVTHHSNRIEPIFPNGHRSAAADRCRAMIVGFGCRVFPKDKSLRRLGANSILMPVTLTLYMLWKTAFFCLLYANLSFELTCGVRRVFGTFLPHESVVFTCVRRNTQ